MRRVKLKLACFAILERMPAVGIKAALTNERKQIAIILRTLARAPSFNGND